MEVLSVSDWPTIVLREDKASEGALTNCRTYFVFPFQWFEIFLFKVFNEGRALNTLCSMASFLARMSFGHCINFDLWICLGLGLHDQFPR